MTINNHTNLFGRRDLLRLGSLGSLGITLDKVLRAAPSKDISCILVWQSGGPSHLDTFDMKPDAPKEYRGEFKPIPTNVPGIQICEHLPRLARMTDKLALIRSMTHGDVNHTTSTHFLLTGRDLPRPDATLAEDWPSYGAVLARLGRGRGPLPPFVSMMPRVPNGAP